LISDGLATVVKNTGAKRRRRSGDPVIRGDDRFSGRTMAMVYDCPSDIHLADTERSEAPTQPEHSWLNGTTMKECRRKMRVHHCPDHPESLLGRDALRKIAKDSREKMPPSFR
jgi:hypothetical protein